jgi:N-acyl-D-amino-acid deacylase
LIDRARAEGQDVLADQYPYTAGSTTLAAILPTWALQGGVDALRRRLADPALRLRIRGELVDRPDGTPRSSREFDPQTIMVSYVPAGPHKRYEGLMLTEIAAERQQEPVDAALHLLEREGGAIQMIIFAMSEDDVRRVMRHPAVAVASDGWTLSPKAGGKPHPRSYGTYARVLGRYVRDERVLSLEEAVRKMTSLPAQRLGRLDRGLIRPGCAADLVVFDPERVIEDGIDTGSKAGRVLRPTPLA